ncbi:hypothetical protein PBI_HAMLET_53 [Microbacterium phage Hamlet]|uniref:Uncharacterized protein n=1 Tax=Microbacterium phage Hamlet TaxID=2079583 RepID=A0A2L0HME8_9CAUD|nr:hypothetical protein FDJ35_gp53 [Microbacterium phage Hamlet]AUX82889.1 hypothetical protein PBI_HAMLET_53 [Microbacterium phage Hamlet]
MKVSVKINGQAVEAELAVIREILSCGHPEQDLISPDERYLDPAYDGRTPVVIEGRKSPEPHTRKHVSSGNLWTEEEVATLLEHFPLSRDTTPPVRSIVKMMHLLPGRSADAIQIRWWSMKKKSS